MASTHLSEPGRRPTGGDPLAEYLATVSAWLPGPSTARIAEFGDPRMVAAAFAPELAAAQARRVALGLLATGPLIGLAWIAAVAVNALPPWHHQLTGPWLALPLVGLALAVAYPALGLTVAAAGRLGRRFGGGFGRRPALPATAAAVAGGAAMLADMTLLAILGGQTLASSRLQVWAPVIVAAGASLTRITLTGWAARRYLATRAALP